ncbi:MAG: protein YgfX [Pseudomonadota bacterium]
MVLQSSYEYSKFYMFLPLELTLRPSRIYAAVLACAHGFALVGLWLAELPLWARAALSLVLAASGSLAWREISSGPSRLRISQSGRIEVFDGEWQPAHVRGRPVVLPWLVSLGLVTETGRYCRLLLWRDSAENELQRKLRVWLRWGPLWGR